MNIFAPQNEQTRVECEEILSASHNFMSGQSSKPMYAMKQDGLLGGYKLTRGNVKVPKHIFNNCIIFDDWSLEYINNKINHIKLVHKWLKLHDKEVELLKNKYTNLSINELNKMAEDNLLYTGHSLFSMLLPNDFEYFKDNTKELKNVGINDSFEVVRGVLISGTINNDVIGSSSGSLIHHLYKDYGHKLATNFISYYEMLINNWLTYSGVSLGVKDCITKEETTVKNIVSESMLLVYTTLQTQRDPELLENEIHMELNNSITLGNNKVKQAFDIDNNFVSMVYSGARGKTYNITQIGGLVGQQNLLGKRIPKTFGGRTLPHFIKYSHLQNAPDYLFNDVDKTSNKDDKFSNIDKMLKLTESRGFIPRSFFRGISPVNFFFQAAASREGLIDSSSKVPDTGYIQRRITKMVEDLKWSYSNTIVNSKNTILDFSYGTDNFDSSQMIKIKTKEKDYFSFIDIKHTVNILNKNVEWTDYLSSIKQIPNDEELSKEINIEIDSLKSILPLEKLPTIVEEKEEIVKEQPLIKSKPKSSILSKPRKEVKPIKKEKKVRTEELEEVEIL